MPQNCIDAAQRLVERAAKVGSFGRKIPRSALDKLEADLAVSFPPWFRQLQTEVPLAGLKLGWQAEEGDEDADGVVWFFWADENAVRNETFEAYPGIAIRGLGYVNVGGGDGSGDPYFICIEEGEDAPLYQIYHDVSEQGSEILAKGRRVVAQSLSQLFDSAMIRRK